MWNWFRCKGCQAKDNEILWLRTKVKEMIDRFMSRDLTEYKSISGELGECEVRTRTDEDEMVIYQKRLGTFVDKLKDEEKK